VVLKAVSTFIEQNCKGQSQPDEIEAPSSSILFIFLEDNLSLILLFFSLDSLYIYIYIYIYIMMMMTDRSTILSP